jgi:hypothetical protein
MKGRSALPVRSQAERRRELERMVGHRLRPSRVIREGECGSFGVEASIEGVKVSLNQGPMEIAFKLPAP